MKRFYQQIIFFYIIILSIISILYFTQTISSLFLLSSLLAAGINLANAFAAVKLFQVSYKKGSSSFMIYNLGGLGIRLMGILIIFLLVIKFLKIDEYAFIFIFFLFYFISLILEVFFYIKYKENSKF
ncbi:MAG: hypothetical protein IPM32_00470 [Ignavibacteriae bacterium]|nr:hypothetical protein [Ignavibacteriota bacterium]